MRTWVIVTLVCAVAALAAVYTTPALHPYIWRNPVDRAIPAVLADPPGTLRDHYARAYRADAWGGPRVDGPDRSMPDQCYWFGGTLHCASVCDTKEK